MISSGVGRFSSRHRLRQEQQRVEALLLVAVEEARARAEGLAVGHQPEVRDAGRHRAARDEIADERVVAVASALGRQDVAVLAGAAEGVAGVDLDHLMAGGAQPVADAGAEPATSTNTSQVCGATLSSSVSTSIAQSASRGRQSGRQPQAATSSSRIGRRAGAWTWAEPGAMKCGDRWKA